ncbi:MAG: hypothetical protein M0004_12680 [Actinomycetota bacterium]|nr:hypothetical protein [Actinomycetota bacterium]
MNRLELRRLVREENPRGLSVEQYERELAACEAARRAIRLAEAVPDISPEQRRRQLQERYAPLFTKDELCSFAERQLIAEAARRR